MAEIKNFKSWRGPALAPGVAGFLHAPILTTHVSGNNSGQSRNETVDCLCGAKLDYGYAPLDQPAPRIWAGLEAFKKHLSERQELAEQRNERMRESHFDRIANTR